MIEIEESAGSVYQDMGFADASDMQAKSADVMKLATLIETAEMSATEAANRLEISLKKLEDVLRGRFRDVPAATIAKYLNQISTNQA